MDIKINNKYNSKPFPELLHLISTLYKSPDSTDFEVTISKKGVDLFQKEHYPSMSLYLENETYIIRGFYNKGEEDFISNYFIGYGKSIISIHPIELSKLICKKIDSLKLHFSSI